MRHRWFGFFALGVIGSATLFGPGCVSLPPIDQPDKKKDDDPKKDPDPKKDEEVGPLRKRLIELKERREAAKEARLKDQLEKLQKAREEREKKEGKEPAPTPPVPEKPVERPAEAKPAKDASLAEWLDKSRAAFAEVKDYTCTFVKRERLGGKLQDEQTAEMACRAQPFSVVFRFTAPRSVQGQEAAYVAGKNNNMVRVKGGGLKGIVGFLSLPPDDPKIMSDNRHTIDQSGIGKLIDQIADADRRSRANPAIKSQVAATEVTFEERECVRLEILLDERQADIPMKSVIYFDRKLRLPTRIENYDPPKKGTAPELQEMYGYTKLKLNAGVKDEAFER